MGAADLVSLTNILLISHPFSTNIRHKRFLLKNEANNLTTDLPLAFSHNTLIKGLLMGRQIVKQPNGKFCIFSTYVDSVIAYDLTSEDVIDFYVEAAAEEAKRQTNQRLSEIAETPQEDVEDIWNHMLTVCERHMESDDFKSFFVPATGNFLPRTSN